MSNIFIVADTHFSQLSICNFLNVDGVKMRPWDNADEMDEALIENWNAVVRPQDKVYHLGDVAMKRDAIKLIGRCNGHKRLVRGNHDAYPMKYYLPFFEEIYGSRVFDDMIFSHIPLHPESVKPRWTCVHGHVHSNIRPLQFGPKYLNVSIEMTEWRPLSIEEVRERIRRQVQEVEERRLESARLLDFLRVPERYRSHLKE
jgi:calcineurin-like phosphoesterase family protein